MHRHNNALHFVCLLLAICGLTATAQTQPAAWNVKFGHNVSGSLNYGDTKIFSISCHYFLEHWRGGAIVNSDIKAINEGKLFARSRRNAPKFTAELDLKQLNENTLHFSYKLTALEKVRLNTLYASFMADASALVGQEYSVDNKPPQTFPIQRETTHMVAPKVTTFTVGTKFGKIIFDFGKPTGFLLQDDRLWNENFTIRLGNDDDSTKEWQPGQAHVFDFKLIFPTQVSIKRSKHTKITAGDTWIPLNEVIGVKKDSALDFTRFNFTDAPAGKYGYVITKGKHFVFEKKTDVPQRFYGINFVGYSQYISHEESIELAERLQRLGYNTVRFHHHDHPSIIATPTSTTELNLKRMDNLDFLFNELKKRGIYSTTDLYVSRGVRKHEIWPGEKGSFTLSEFKQILPINRRAMENWKTYARNFLTHRNPYTGLTYAEDPALSWISMINEGTPNIHWANLEGRIGEEWLAAWQAWLDKKYKTPEARNKAWGAERSAKLTKIFEESQTTDNENRDFCLFLEETFLNMFAEMKDFVRNELGCKALLTDMNYSTVNSWAQNIRRNYDYVDHHFYVDHPSFLDQPWHLPSSCPNQSVIKQGELGGTFSAWARMFDRPFTISEYNYSGPGRYRGIGGILTGCLGSIQDWAGIWRFAYAHGTPGMFNIAPTNYFDMCRDPLNQAAERATLLLYLRQDMKPAEHSIALTIPRDFTQTSKRVLENTVPSWRNLVSIAQVGTVLGNDNFGKDTPTITVPLHENAPTAGAVVRVDNPLQRNTQEKIADVIKEQKWFTDDNITDFTKHPMPCQTANKQFTMIPERDIMILDTPLTAGGFAPANETIKTASLTIDIKDTDATVWASSLDNAPLKSSKHILLTHLTDLTNTDMHFADEDRKVLLAWGKPPHLVRQGRANVSFNHPTAKKITVWTLRTDGERLEQVPVVKTSDGFKMDLSINSKLGARILYEIIVE